MPAVKVRRFVNPHENPAYTAKSNITRTREAGKGGNDKRMSLLKEALNEANIERAIESRIGLEKSTHHFW